MTKIESIEDDLTPLEIKIENHLRAGGYIGFKGASIVKGGYRLHELFIQRTDDDIDHDPTFWITYSTSIERWCLALADQAGPEIRFVWPVSKK